jgi:hypothetical protein
VFFGIWRQAEFSIFHNSLRSLARPMRPHHISSAQAFRRLRIDRPGPSGQAICMSLKEDMPCELST